ncbi:MAG: isochorismatase [Deltaproteobacteria bacterium]|nr:isochorismatase [Deltaproteobacteria bacterium]
MARNELPLPPHFDPGKIGQVWKIPYQERAEESRAWAKEYGISPAHEDTFRICLVAVDVQNTFCIPGFELFVGGRSGTGAIDDNRRLCEFIYRNLPGITGIRPTLDTHQLMQIFHPIFLVDKKGSHPVPFTLVSEEDLRVGRWKFNPCVAKSLGITLEYGQEHLVSYAKKLRESGKYDLTIWPYHAMQGGIGHALVAALEEAIFFHGVTRCSQPVLEIKGKNPLTEHYSALGPEVLEGPGGEPIARKHTELIDLLLGFDAVIIAGQAKSHCVAWTISDLLEDIRVRDDRLAGKVYLLEDCTSPVVIPGVVDYTEEAEAAFRKFPGAGMHVVRSTDPMECWPAIRL